MKNREQFEKFPLYLAYKLVEEGKIDPWDVDLEKLIKEYLEEIRRIELKDLRVPAKVVAFATFLIKKQLEILFPKPPRTKRRKITLKEIEEDFEKTSVEELVKPLPRKVVRKSPCKRKKKKEKPSAIPPLHKAKLEEILKELINLLQKLKKEELLPFSRYATRNDYVAKLWGLLNLTYDGKAVLRQEKPFGEIYFGSLSTNEKNKPLKKPKE